jgi:hypothetical protein
VWGECCCPVHATLGGDMCAKLFVVHGTERKVHGLKKKSQKAIAFWLLKNPPVSFTGVHAFPSGDRHAKLFALHGTERKVHGLKKKARRLIAF